MADRAAFEGFYREHVPRVVRGCTLVLLDQAAAEDVAAEAFARLWSKWGHPRRRGTILGLGDRPG